MFTATVITPNQTPESPWEPCRPVAFDFVSTVGNFSTVGLSPYTAKVTTYPQPSHFGFVGGCICKLEVFKDGVRVWSYDRGLYLGFLERAGREFLAALVSRFN